MFLLRSLQYDVRGGLFGLLRCVLLSWTMQPYCLYAVECVCVCVVGAPYILVWPH